MGYTRRKTQNNPYNNFEFFPAIIPNYQNNKMDLCKDFQISVCKTLITETCLAWYSWYIIIDRKSLKIIFGSLTSNKL